MVDRQLRVPAFGRGGSWARRGVAALMSVFCLVAWFMVGASPASAAGPAPAQVQILYSPSYDFGTVRVGGSSASQTFQVANVGGADSGPLSVSVQGANGHEFAFADTCHGVVLHEFHGSSNEECTITVNFRPASLGARSAVLTVSGKPGGTAQLPLTGTGGTAKLVPGAAPSFRGTRLGATSDAQSVTFVNNGVAASGPVSLGFGGANVGDFVQAGTTCGPSIPVGGQCTVSVVFAPKALGTRSATLTASASPGGSVTVALTGDGWPPDVAVVPASYDFGFVPVGTAASVPFDVENRDQFAVNGPITVTISGPDQRFFTVTNNCPSSLGPNYECVVFVRFQPTAVGSFHATMTVSGNPVGAVTVALSGAGPTPALPVLSPGSADFGSVPTDAPSAPVTFTVINKGQSAAGPVTVSLSGPNPGDFLVDASTCPSLPGQGSCTITVRFAPGVAGRKFASLVVATAGSTLQASLAGSAFDRAQLAISPATTDLGSVPADQSTAAKTLTVVNNGHLTSGPVSVAVTGTAAAQFAIDSTDCGTGLAPGARCSVVVHFNAGETGGTTTATLTASATPGGPATGTLQAETVLPPELTWTQSSYAYNDPAGGAADFHDFTLTNTGVTATVSYDLFLESTDGTNISSIFRVVTNTCPASIPRGASCVVTVEYDAPADGSGHSAYLAACPTDVDGACPYVALQGTPGVFTASLSVAAPTDFGQVLTGSSGADQTVTVRNAGVRVASGPISVSVTGPNASDFTVDSSGCTRLAPGQTCQVKVHFMPGAVGDRTATLNVSADPGGGRRLTLHGTGVDVAVTPAAYTFPQQPQGTTSAPVDFVVTNHGSAPLANLTVTGTDPSDLPITGGSCLNATVPVGASCTVSVAFNGGAPGTYRSTFTVTYLAGGSPQTLTFTATGTS